MFSWCLPTDHEIYNVYNSSVKNITVSSLIKVLSNYNVCEGIKNDQVFSQCQQNIVLKKFIPFECNNQIWENKFYRSPSCSLLTTNDKLQEVTNNTSCKNCLKYESTKLSQMKKINTKQKNVNLTPAKSKAPISKLSNERVKITLQHYRIENKSLMSQINELKQAIEKSSVKVSEELSEDLVTIVSNADHSKMPPFMKFFWEEQQKYLRASPRGIRYHPMIIRYCLSLASKSAGAYDEIPAL